MGYAYELVKGGAVDPLPFGHLWLLAGRESPSAKLLRRLVEALPRGRYVSNSVKFRLVRAEAECPKHERKGWLFPERWE